jgi:hypothetical protein
MVKKPVADDTAKKVPGRPFKAGADWTGNAAGRPKGARSRLTEDFLSAVAEDFEKHGKSALTKVREEDPSTYLRVVAQLIPKESELNIKGDDAFVKVWTAVASGTMAAIVDQLEEEARH